MSVRCPDSVEANRMSFLGADRVRIVGLPLPKRNVERGDLTIMEVDLGTKKIREIGHLPDVDRSALFFLQGLGGPALLVRDRHGDATTFGLFDASTGTPIAALATCGADASCPARLLADGRVVVGEASSGGAVLRVFSPAGVAVRSVPLPAGRRIQLGLEPTAGTLVVALAPDRLAEWKDRTTLLVDLARGTWGLLGRGYRPAGWYWWLSRTPVAPGSVASRLFFDPQRSLVVLDPSTDTFKTLVEVR